MISSNESKKGSAKEKSYVESSYDFLVREEQIAEEAIMDGSSGPVEPLDHGLLKSFEKVVSAEQTRLVGPKKDLEDCLLPYVYSFFKTTQAERDDARTWVKVVFNHPCRKRSVHSVELLFDSPDGIVRKFLTYTFHSGCRYIMPKFLVLLLNWNLGYRLHKAEQERHIDGGKISFGTRQTTLDSLIYSYSFCIESSPMEMKKAM